MSLATKTLDVVVAGRAGIDLNPSKTGCTFEHNPSFEKSIGGSPANIVIGNREEFNVVEFLTTPENRDNETSAKQILAQGVTRVIVKDGSNGSWGYTQGEETISKGIIPTKALKTFGSGDAYAAGFLYGLVNQKGLAQSMELGTANASLALTKEISCSNAMPYQDELLTHWKQNLICWEGRSSSRVAVSVAERLPIVSSFGTRPWKICERTKPSLSPV